MEINLKFDVKFKHVEVSFANIMTLSDGTFMQFAEIFICYKCFIHRRKLLL